jgi:predicted nuclease of predicted toxin-antitoxin system
MKLLFDHHLSRKLIDRLADIFPDASHVALHRLDAADDIRIWTFARDQDYTIVTKDSDFNDVSALRGAPPKIVWLRIGNCTTGEVEQTLRRHAVVIRDFIASPNDIILEITRYTS